MKTALIQLNSSDDPVGNLPVTTGLVDRAAKAGASFILTPEVTNCVSLDRRQQRAVLQNEDDDRTLAALRFQAAELKIWLLIGSLALKSEAPDGRFANRSFLITPLGDIAARYDKIHMFDVEVSETECYRESEGYRAGDCSVLAEMPTGDLGMTICYDIRFPHLYRSLAQAGASVLSVPSAFSPVTGKAHWETLLRARAIETGSYVLAPAQTGLHSVTSGRARKTYGHSMAIGPWGEVLADAGTEPGIIYVDLDPSEVAKARQRIPSLVTEIGFNGP
ncbi:2-oxoglutaramate amidase [Roseovarius litorisediminis]|uniref:2-oxoglutaramate amidase n=1 Tax=Roseovarius litorisediminis TaxID=1312363 RepID=A0A1Y5SQL3_9RHOB|nr:carbon-nitrogen hydrolase family protein [Roseovarius litorisediminis]SLN43076.1 2-oxoglutaramate amidase [Roseovarius litorisediminis]